MGVLTSFLRHCQTVFHSSCAILHYYQQAETVNIWSGEGSSPPPTRDPSVARRVGLGLPQPRSHPRRSGWSQL